MNRWPNPMHRCSRDIEAPYSSEHRSCTTAERFLNFLIPGPSSASFPLTPTLSLRERGRQRAALELSDGLRSADQRAAILTLPEGEGGGEGEQEALKENTPNVPELTRCPTRKSLLTSAATWAVLLNAFVPCVSFAHDP